MNLEKLKQQAFWVALIGAAVVLAKGIAGMVDIDPFPVPALIDQLGDFLLVVLAAFANSPKTAKKLRGTKSLPLPPA